MKQVLFITYYFPPIGGAGVQRSAKFVKYLPEFGWRPIVLTVRPNDYSIHREFKMDGSLSQDVEGRCEVHRTRDYEPRRVRGALEKLHLFRVFWFLLYPVFWEKEFFWALGAIPRALKIIRERRPCAIYTSSAPYSLIVVGFLLRLWARVPWVADLRDLWTQDSLLTWPSRLHYRATVAAERFMLRRADTVVANTPLAAQRMRELLGAARAERVVAIPNGYDEEDIPKGSPSPQNARPLTITHVGTFHDLRHAAGGDAGRNWMRRLAGCMSYQPFALDRSMRTPKVLLEGLKIILDRSPELRGKIRLCFIGYLHEGWRARIKDLGLEDSVAVPGYVPHAEAMALLGEADVLFCVQVGFEDRAKAVPYVPAKLYEYLATGKPILAPVAEGDTKDVLRRSGLGIAADPVNPEDIACVLLDLYTRHCNGGIRLNPNWKFIQRFERRETAAQLAEVLKNVTEATCSEG
jgi:glycosyltransferase involved in cell wall biosynthesis